MFRWSERWWLLLLAPFVIYLGFTVGDRIWPVTGVHEALAGKPAVLVYFVAASDQQLRAYVVIPDSFQTGLATVVTSTGGKVAVRQSRGPILNTALIFGVFWVGGLWRRWAATASRKS